MGCRSETELSTALRQARKSGFALRSGGHCFEGFSQHEETVIDLGEMTHLRYSDEAEIKAGPAVKIGQINALTGPRGQVLPAGFCTSVALGGHVTGGGLGLYARSFGLACDHLKAARVMLADGQVVTASPENHSDLFWAIRGGGGSFGIVTEFTLRVRPAPQVTLVRFFLGNDIDTTARILSQWQRMAEQLPQQLGAVMFIRNAGLGNVGLELMVQSLLPQEQTKAIAQNIFAISALKVNPRIYIGQPHEIANVIWRDSPETQASQKVLSDYIHRPITEDIWRDALQYFLSFQTGRLDMVLDLIGGAVDQVMPSETAYPHRGNGQFIAQYIMSMRPDMDTEAQINDLRKLRAYFESAAQGGVYVNYPDRGLSDYSTRYWGDNLSRLQAIKRRYDPENVFQHPQSVPLA